MAGDTSTDDREERASRWVVWALVLLMLLSFGFGVFMFFPQEHRTQKLDEMMYKYKARQRG